MNVKDLVIGKTYIKSTPYDHTYKVIYKGLFGGTDKELQNNHCFESVVCSSIQSVLSEWSVINYIS